MESTAELVAARFVDRPNRFVVRAVVRNDPPAEAHLADPGRLRELLLPGAELRLRPADAPGRRTRYSVALVRAGSTWVSLETTRANRLAEPLLRRGVIESIPPGLSLRREAPLGSCRFDFLLEGEQRPRTWVEVKSVTLVEAGRGLFPDAPTARGRRHVEGLERRARAGDQALLLFVVQRGDASELRLHAGIDPDLAVAVGRAGEAGVLLRAVRFGLDAQGQATYLGPIPVRQGGLASGG